MQMPAGQGNGGIRDLFNLQLFARRRVTKRLWAIRDVVDVFEAWETTAR
jgi:hypothetical protein